MFYLKVQKLTFFLENLGSNSMPLYVPENVSLYFQNLGTTFTNLTIFALLFLFLFYFMLADEFSILRGKEKKKKLPDILLRPNVSAQTKPKLF